MCIFRRKESITQDTFTLSCMLLKVCRIGEKGNRCSSLYILCFLTRFKFSFLGRKSQWRLVSFFPARYFLPAGIQRYENDSSRIDWSIEYRGDDDLKQLACHGRERAQLAALFVRWPNRSRFSKDPAHTTAECMCVCVFSPLLTPWTDTRAARLDDPGSWISRT